VLCASRHHDAVAADGETATLWRPTGPGELAMVSFLDHYDVHQAGSKAILGYWIPAEDLPALNASIVGTIEVTAEYH
jgi:hypothetical protein